MLNARLDPFLGHLLTNTSSYKPLNKSSNFFGNHPIITTEICFDKDADHSFRYIEGRNVMPFILECHGLKGESLEKCKEYYAPIHRRNAQNYRECLKGEDGNIECFKLLGATCEGDPKPPPCASPRQADPRLYDKYVKPSCPNSSSEKAKANESSSPVHNSDEEYGFPPEMDTYKFCGFDRKCEHGPYVIPKGVRDIAGFVKEYINPFIGFVIPPLYKKLLGGKTVGEVIGRGDNAGEAISSYLDTLPNKPKIISFGERHLHPKDRERGVKSTGHVFANEVLPAVCKKYNGCEVVIEMLPFMNPAVPSELEYYFGNKEHVIDQEHTPVLWASTVMIDPDLTVVLEKARELRFEGYDVNIYGGHVDTQKFLAFAYKAKTGMTEDDYWPFMIDVGSNTAIQALSLMVNKPDRVVVTFGGKMHLEAEPDQYIGEKAAQLGLDRIDEIYLPKIFARFPDFDLSREFVAVGIVDSEQRHAMMCADARNMQMICSGSSSAVTMVDMNGTGYAHLTMVLPRTTEL